MKPTNKFQKRIVELSGKLPAISDNQRKWAEAHCFKPIGFLSGGKVWCLLCGNVFEIQTDSASKTQICPYCKKKLELKKSKKRIYNEALYYSIITTFKGFQVCRHFIVEKDIYKVQPQVNGCDKPVYTIREVVQNWIDKDGNEVIIARPTKPIPYIYDAWNYEEPMSIKRVIKESSSYNPMKYSILTCYVYPYQKVLPILKRNGYNRKMNLVPYNELFKMLIKDREAEMLIKNKQYALLAYKWNKNCKEYKMPFAHSIRIANRNRYIVKDASDWIDYLRMLEYIHLDTHNAYYVCPTDFSAAHAKVLRKKQKIEEEEAIHSNINTALKWEDRYRKAKKKYLGICFGNKDIVVTVIQSVREMLEEGTRMHHCVFSMGYYKEKDSLILSAKDKQGKRIETVEVNLKTYSIVQSKAVCNKTSDFHDEIIELVNQNMNLIRKAS